MSPAMTDDQVIAHLAAERAKGIEAMDALSLMVILMGNDEPDWGDCDVELSRRAMAGDLESQRGVFGLFRAMWEAGRISDREFVTQAEPVARLAADQGISGDQLRLAGLLAVRSAHLRNVGSVGLAHEAQVEALTLVGAIANDADDQMTMETATREFRELARGFSADAVEQARNALWCNAVADFDQVIEPEVIAAAIKRLGK